MPDAEPDRGALRPSTAARREAVAALRRAATVVARAVRAGARTLPQRGDATPAQVVTDYKAPNYWLDYRCGFVRRGLPGELLRRFVGGSPTKPQVEAVAVGLSRAAVLSVRGTVQGECRNRRDVVSR